MNRKGHLLLYLSYTLLCMGKHSQAKQFIGQIVFDRWRCYIGTATLYHIPSIEIDWDTCERKTKRVHQYVIFLVFVISPQSVPVGDDAARRADDAKIIILPFS